MKKIQYYCKIISQKISFQWQRKSFRWLVSSVLVILFFLILFFTLIWQAPTDFPAGSIYTVNKGEGLTKIASNLMDNKVIKSPFWFKTFIVIMGGTKNIMAGDYVLPEKQKVFTIAYRLAHGDFELQPIRITIPEGLNIYEIADQVSQKIPKIIKEEFIKEASQYEGYLFPDTYYFLPNSNSLTILNAMRENFNKKIISLSEQLKKFEKSLPEVIIMSSILEEEACTVKTKQIIAGILWKRLSLNMPLQVDASFKYINGKGTKDLTLADLKIDSPYNTYLYKGLPPTPISNPGLDSITAAINPTTTDYLFFLSDKNGVMHYAKTFAEHVRNKNLYL